MGALVMSDVLRCVMCMEAKCAALESAVALIKSA
jgi:hypothetical protein